MTLHLSSIVGKSIEAKPSSKYPNIIELLTKSVIFSELEMVAGIISDNWLPIEIHATFFSTLKSHLENDFA